MEPRQILRLLRIYRRLLRKLESLRRKRRAYSSIAELKAKLPILSPEEKLRLFDHHHIKRECSLLASLFLNAQAWLNDKDVIDAVEKLGYSMDRVYRRINHLNRWFETFKVKAEQHEALLKAQVKGKVVAKDKINKLESQLINDYEKYKVLLMASLERTIYDIQNASWYPQVRRGSMAAIKSAAASLMLTLTLGCAGAAVINPNTVYAKETAAEAAAGEGEKEETEDEKKELEARIAETQAKIKEDEKNPGLHHTLSGLYEQYGNHDRALAEFGLAVKYGLKAPVRKENLEASKHNNLGVRLTAQRKYGEAIKELEQAIKLDPGEAKYLHNLARVYRNQDKDVEAIKFLRASIKLNPTFALNYTVLAFIYRNQKDYNKSIFHAKIALLLNPAEKGPYFNLGYSLKMLGQHKEAISAFEEYLKSRKSALAERLKQECERALREKKE